MKPILAGLGLLGLVASAQAQNRGQPQPQPSFGAGGTLCSQYSRAARYSDILYHQASSWLLGYVSGVSESVRASGQASPLDGVSGEQVLHAAASYCDANPTDTIAKAANVWVAAAPKPPTAPPQGEAKRDDDNWIKLNLTAPARKPLLDRR